MDIVLRCIDVDGMLAFFTTELGCRLELVTPADEPREFVVTAPDGSSLRLVRDTVGRPVELRWTVDEWPDPGRHLEAPDGTTIDIVVRSDEIDIPANAPSLSVEQAPTTAEFGEGRAGMGYRDLLPDRWGGRFIASHIVIADGGEVADYVHYHRIRFQMIFVAAGWVEVVYEDQGEAFRMHAGDCVLQPPEIRHRVLRSSPGLEVIEIGCPAEHDTLVEHEITLPTPMIDTGRLFGGQRFVRHVAADVAPVAATTPGFLARSTGIDVATDGLADVQVLTVDTATAASTSMTHDGEFAMYVGLNGCASMHVDVGGDETEVEIGPRDALALPPASRWTWGAVDDGFEVLEVVLSADALRVATQM